jgi:DNA-binding transcriptional LysR family regulator
VEPLLTGFRALEQRASALGAGGKTEISLSVDSIFPDSRLFAALAELTRLYPHVRPQLRQTMFLSSVHEFASYGADLCISGLPTREYFAKPILDIRMRAVARSDHPLNKGTRQLSRLDLIQCLAVIIEGAVGSTPKKQPHSPLQRYLAVNTLDAATEAVRSGICFGWLPLYKIAPYIDSGELTSLRLTVGSERVVRFFLICKDVDSASAERNYLAALLGADREVETI